MAPQPEFLNALVIASAHQDGAAFAELYRLTSPRLFAAARRLLREEADAREALQDIFTHIRQRAASFDPERGQALHWMGGILRYACLDRLRKHKRLAASDDKVADVAEDAVEPGIIARLDIARCMRGLSRAERQMILLAVQRGYSHSEITMQTGIPLGTVKSHVRRGLGKLRLCLEAVAEHA